MKKRTRVLIALACFGVVASFYLATQTYRNFKVIKDFPVTSWVEDHKADCAIVLTGGPNRINDAFEQLYLKRVKKIIVSGTFPSVQLHEIFPAHSFYGDLDKDDIILEKRSLTTYGNAQQALPLVEALNCKDVVLITSRIHMYRAYNTFRSHFPKDIPIYQRSTLGRRFQPHWSRLLAEVLKTLFYDFWFF